MTSTTTKAKPQEVLDFLLDFSTTLIAAGAQASRTLRNVYRLSQTFGYTVHTIILPRTVIMTIEGTSVEGERDAITEARKIPQGAINFTTIAELRKLSWDACDTELCLCECKKRYEDIKNMPRFSGFPLILAVSCANAALCQLFGGWEAIPLVFIGTFFGFGLRYYLNRKEFPEIIVLLLCAFVASFTIGLGSQFFEIKTNIALSTSVLFLVPGIPLLMSVVDIIDGHPVSGISKFVNAMLLIMSLTMGLVITIVILGIKL